ncbi:MAG: addiction module protein [Hyphomicrobiales bacterium]
MSDKARRLGQDARKLTATERIELVEDILDSLDERSEALDRLWAKEARDRLDGYRQGKITARELSDIVARYRRP